MLIVDGTTTVCLKCAGVDETDRKHDGEPHASQWILQQLNKARVLDNGLYADNNYKTYSHRSHCTNATAAFLGDTVACHVQRLMKRQIKSSAACSQFRRVN